MLTIKQIKNQLKINQWESQLAIASNDCNRLLELNAAKLMLLDLLVNKLEIQLNKKQLISKVG